METSLILLAAIVLFFIANLSVGIYKGPNVTTIQDYALANRSMGTGTLIVTLIATMIGAKYLGNKVTCTSVDGFGIVMAVTVAFAFFWISLVLGFFIFPRMLRFKNSYTMGDIMGKLYGKNVQIVTGLLSTGCFVFMIVSQLVAIGNLGDELNLSQSIVILLIGSFITLYTFWKGVPVVVATDLLQFAFVFGGFLVIAFSVLNHEKISQGFFDLLQKSNEKYPWSLQIFSHRDFFNRLFGPIYFGIIFFSPPVIQRVLMARNRSQVKKTFMGFAFLYFLLQGLLIIIGLGFLLVNGTKPPKGEIPVMKIILDKILYGAVWEQVLLVLMLLALVMSTVDSFINAISIVIVNDIIQPLSGNTAKSSNALHMIRSVSLYLGVGCTLLALLMKESLSIDLFHYPLGIFAALIVPFVMGIWGLKSGSKAVFLSIISFLILIGIGFYYCYTHYIGWMATFTAERYKLSFVVVGVFFLFMFLYPLIHAILNRGLIFEKIEKPEVGIRDIIARRRNKETFFLPIS